MSLIKKTLRFYWERSVSPLASKAEGWVVLMLRKENWLSCFNFRLAFELHDVFSFLSSAVLPTSNTNCSQSQTDWFIFISLTIIQQES